MARIKNHKPIIILLALFFFIVSFVGLFAPGLPDIERVRVKNQEIVISQGNTLLANTQLDMINTSKIKNEDIDSLNKEFKMNNSDFTISNNETKTNFASINNKNIKYKNKKVEDKNVLQNNIKKVLESNNTTMVLKNSNQYKKEFEKYRYKNINWGLWKSRFVNKILDDSMYIRSLDNYGLGTWFYYSFKVSNTGEIFDITIFSLYLNSEDRLKIRELIESYSGRSITIFPEGSKRKEVLVKAIMLLGDNEQKANSSNFGDTERVKIRY